MKNETKESSKKKLISELLDKKFDKLNKINGGLAKPCYGGKTYPGCTGLGGGTVCVTPVPRCVPSNP